MKILEFAQIIGRLKKTKRIGWVNFKIPSGESVAEHSFRTAILAMILAPEFKVDQNKAIKMALIHDVAEAEIGDIKTHERAKALPNLKGKLDREKVAFANIFLSIGKKEFIKLFDEFNENKTKTAQFVKQLDKLEAAIQALEYESEHSVDLSEIIDHAKAFVTDKKLRQILDGVENLRKKK